ncbi:MAG: HAMP domain-containing histidine kinase [Oscillospiraceae bacterium]|nr:HAMP domain-containing histidine kinase [Oscillospiraceae bacterium]
MIKKLNRRFVAITMAAITALLIIIMGVVNVANYVSVIGDADNMLTMISRSDGRFPKDFLHMGKRDMTPETPFETRFFSVTLASDGTVEASDLGFIAAVDEEEAVSLAASAVQKGAEKGWLGSYRYLITAKGGSSLVVFVDTSRDMQQAGSFLIISAVTTVVALGVMFLVVSLAAGRATKPIAESYEKQRRFITDAGHELKTPIAIINADTEVIELDGGETEWTRDIKAQTKRLSDLTADLIFLSRMEETDRSMNFIPFPFSDMVVDAAQSFVALAKTQNRALTVDVEPMLEVTGDEKALRQLVGILLDNAIKYSPEGGNIELKAYKSGKNVVLSVTNDAENVTQDSVKHMFDRFYRGDESREKKPGYGIGLSIAKAVAEAHKGKISAEYSGGKVKMTVTI